MNHLRTAAQAVVSAYRGEPGDDVTFDALVDALAEALSPSERQEAAAAGQGERDGDLRAAWRSAGGSFHGPNIETGTMPESDLLPFLRSLSRASLPQGQWQWVPKEPTLEMSVAFAEAFYAKVRAIDDDNITDWWKAMLAAAPSQPAQGGA